MSRAFLCTCVSSEVNPPTHKTREQPQYWDWDRHGTGTKTGTGTGTGMDPLLLCRNQTYCCIGYDMS